MARDKAAQGRSGQEVKELGFLGGKREYILQMIHQQRFLGVAFILVNGEK